MSMLTWWRARKGRDSSGLLSSATLQEFSAISMEWCRAKYPEISADDIKHMRMPPPDRAGMEVARQKAAELGRRVGYPVEAHLR